MSNHLRDDASTHQISMGRRSLMILHLKGFRSLFTWVQKKRDSDLLFMLKVNFSAPLRYFGYFYEYFYYQSFQTQAEYHHNEIEFFFVKRFINITFLSMRGSQDLSNDLSLNPSSSFNSEELSIPY